MKDIFNVQDWDWIIFGVSVDYLKNPLFCGGAACTELSHVEREKQYESWGRGLPTL